MSARDYDVDMTAFKHAAHELERHEFQAAAGRTVAYALRRAANAIRRKVREALRGHRRTGRLASNVRVRYQGTGLAFESLVWSSGPIAHLIVGGVRPHRIEPGKVMPIHASGRRGPVVAFAYAVESPGFPADPYFRKGVKAAAPEINAIFDKSAETMAAELAYRLSRRR